MFIINSHAFIQPVLSLLYGKHYYRHYIRKMFHLAHKYFNYIFMYTTWETIFYYSFSADEVLNI